MIQHNSRLPKSQPAYGLLCPNVHGHELVIPSRLLTWLL
jgi:hypothetical protein